MGWRNRDGTVAYDHRPHAERSWRRRFYLWCPWLVARGAHGRRHERRAMAREMGWEAEQNMVESNEPAECPFTKARYVNQWVQGRRDWRLCNGMKEGA